MLQVVALPGGKLKSWGPLPARGNGVRRGGGAGGGGVLVTEALVSEERHRSQVSPASHRAPGTQQPCAPPGRGRSGRGGRGRGTC